MQTISKWMFATAATAGLGLSGAAMTAVAADTASDRTVRSVDNAAEKIGQQADRAVDSAENNAAAPLALPAGFQEKDVHAVGGVKSGLAKLTNRFATKGDFNRMLAELSTPSKEEAREFKGVDQGKLDQQIDTFRTAWKNKYGKDFDLSDEKTVFDQRFQIVQGEVADPVVALANWPVSNTLGSEAVTAGSRTPADRNADRAADKQVKSEARDNKLEKGRNVALIRFPAQGHMQPITVSMLHEMPMFYRVDVPRDRTGEQIYNDTLAQLTKLNEHANQWPTDVNDAYRAVARHAIAAVYGIEPMSSARTAAEKIGATR